MAVLQIIIELVLIGLLAATLAFAIRLERGARQYQAGSR